MVRGLVAGEECSARLPGGDLSHILLEIYGPALPEQPDGLGNK